MKKYKYTARDERGKVNRGVMMAVNDVELANKISNLGYYLTDFREARDSEFSAGKSKTVNMSAKDLLDFTIQLNTLIDAGLPLLEGLRDLAREAENERIQSLIDDVRFKVEGGTSLKDAMSAYPESFPQLYVSLIGAGEATGKLPQVLQDLAGLLEWQMDLVGKIKEASIYPLVLFSVMVGVVLLLVIKVIPIFEPMFDDMGVALPLPTQIVMGFSQLVRSYWYVWAGTIFALIVSYKIYYKQEKGRYRIDSLKLKLPVFGQLLRKIALSRFTHTFVLCFRTGLNLLTALDISKKTTGNYRIEQAIAKAKESVNVGEKLATSLQMSGEFPGMVIRMIAVGEQSGALAQTLSKVSEFYDKEVTATVKKIFALFEPFMIVIMGLVVGGIAMSIFLPLFSLIGQVGD